MTAPPSTKPDLNAFPGANREVRNDQFLSRKTLTREAIKVVSAMGVDVRPARVRKLVDRFIDDGRSDLIDDHRTVEGFRHWFITYLDPTGETAVRNVMRSLGR